MIKFYIDIFKKLQNLIPKIKKQFNDNHDKILHIKFSADGAQIIKHKTLLNITFTILNEGSKSKEIIHVEFLT